MKDGKKGSSMPKVSLPSIKTFTQAYESFLSKQRWARELSCRYCKKSGELPKKVGMDCTQICLKFENMAHIITPRESYQCYDKKDTVEMLYIVNKTPMVYIDKKRLRDRAKSYLIGTCVRTYKKDKNVTRLRNMYKSRAWHIDEVRGWKATKKTKLLKELIDAGGKTFVDLLTWYEENQDKIEEEVRLLLGDILRALANYVPLFKLSPNPINNIACVFNETMMDDSKKRAQLTEYVPVYVLIYDGLKPSPEMKDNDTIPPSWPQCLTELIRDLGKRSKLILKTLITERNKSKELSVMDEDKKVMFSDENVCGTSTSHEPHHLRPRYDLYSETDKYRMEQKDAKERRKHARRVRGQRETELVGDCKKHFEDHAKMSSGTLTAMCLEHRQTFLYSNLKTCESVDNYFTALLMYYPGKKAPSDLISDNPCNIQPYMMYREPEKFQDMQQHSDIFHGWAGHKCGPLYCSKYWKKAGKKYKKLNTSLIESNNAILKRIFTSALWMRLDTFNLYFKLILEIQNRRVIREQEKKHVF